MLDQIRFGMTLGYKPCCIAWKLGMPKISDQTSRFQVDSSDDSSSDDSSDISMEDSEPPDRTTWAQGQRRKEGFYSRWAHEDWVKKHIQEATGLTEFNPCPDCVDLMLEHVWKNLWRGKQTKKAWREATRMVVGSRKWALSTDPPLEELRKQADKLFPAGTVQQKGQIITEFKEQARVQ